MGNDEKLESKCDNGNIFDSGGTLYRALLWYVKLNAIVLPCDKL